MKPENNEQFYNEAQEIINKLKEELTQVIEDYTFTFTCLESNSYDTVGIYCFLTSLKNICINATANFNELLKHASELFDERLRQMLTESM